MGWGMGAGRIRAVNTIRTGQIQGSPAAAFLSLCCCCEHGMGRLNRDVVEFAYSPERRGPMTIEIASSPGTTIGLTATAPSAQLRQIADTISAGQQRVKQMAAEFEDQQRQG